MFGKNKSGNNPSASPTEAERNKQEFEEKRELEENLSRIKHKFVVLSGKGGVGKSTVAVNLAVSLADRGYSVGLLDIDIHGPSIPKLLGIEDRKPYADEYNKMVPVTYNASLKVISIGFLLQRNEDAIIWRGPLKYGVIKQFLKDVSWGELDYLIIDSPPGTGDEPLSVCQLINNADGALIVTTPQDVALLDVKKSITFCRKLNMPIIGVIENMSGFTCPHCGERIEIFKSGGGKRMSEEMNVPFLGSIPIDGIITDRGDAGKPFVSEGDDASSHVRDSFNKIVNQLLKEKNGGTT
jgi:ATP-binding protein involved in chromosome partitioning